MSLEFISLYVKFEKRYWVTQEAQKSGENHKKAYLGHFESFTFTIYAILIKAMNKIFTN